MVLVAAEETVVRKVVLEIKGLQGNLYVLFTVLMQNVSEKKGFS